MHTKKTRIGLFDDHPSVLLGIENELKQHESTIELVFTSTTRSELIELTQAHLPSVLILDIISDDVTGLELIEKVRKEYSQISIISYSSLMSPLLVENLLSLGVKGYVSKRQKLSDLIEAIHSVSLGQVYVPSAYKHLTSNFRANNTSLLSAREIEIINLISDGMKSSEIAVKLGLSESTIESHRQRIFARLNVKNVAQLVKQATKLGYIN